MVVWAQRCLLLTAIMICLTASIVLRLLSVLQVEYRNSSVPGLNFIMKIPLLEIFD